MGRILEAIGVDPRPSVPLNLVASTSLSWEPMNTRHPRGRRRRARAVTRGSRRGGSGWRRRHREGREGPRWKPYPSAIGAAEPAARLCATSTSPAVDVAASPLKCLCGSGVSTPTPIAASPDLLCLGMDGTSGCGSSPASLCSSLCIIGKIARWSLVCGWQAVILDPSRCDTSFRRKLQTDALTNLVQDICKLTTDQLELCTSSAM